jgi:hypothetical protein
MKRLYHGVMAGPWRLDKLAAAAGETEDRLRWYAEAGLLHRQANGEFGPDSLHRLRLIQFARSHGVGDEKLAAENARQGDLLGLSISPTQPVTPRQISSLRPGSSILTMP